MLFPFSFNIQTLKIYKKIYNLKKIGNLKSRKIYAFLIEKYMDVISISHSITLLLLPPIVNYTFHLLYS